MLARAPAGVAIGWDAADALANEWTEERAAEFVAAAVSTEKKSDTDLAPVKSGKQRQSQRQQRGDFIDRVVNIDGVELWRDAGGPHTPPHRASC
jgi:hypothetical protein